jgi:hypothetical protein
MERHVSKSIMEIAQIWRLTKLAMAETIHFSSVLILAEAVAGWFYPKNPTAPLPAIPALHGVRVEMVRRLLGIHSEQDKTTGETTYYPLGHAQLLRRLLKAGIDATRSPWRIVDQKAVGWTWFQLRNAPNTFREGEQTRLMGSKEEPPPINIPWQKNVTEIQQKQKLIAELEQAIPKHFMREISDHFGREPQLPRKGIGL